jgi:hypothetical protein
LDMFEGSSDKMHADIHAPASHQRIIEIHKITTQVH